MAFQIIDDCSDLISPPGIVGKSTYKDFVQGKMTLPLICLVKKLSKEDKQKTNALFQKSREEIVGLLREYEVMEQSLGKAREYLDRAKVQLTVLQDSEAKESLSLLTDYLLERLNANVGNYQLVSGSDYPNPA